jgi:hypothetical protein
VFIQTKKTHSGWHLWAGKGHVLAGLSGINFISPDWSYLFLKDIAPHMSEDYAFLKKGAIGPGINSLDQEMIIAAIT